LQKRVNFKHLDGLKVTAVFSDCKKFRYRLTIELPSIKNEKTICVIMQNPSDANSEVADKSVQFLEKLIFEKNYKELNEIGKIIIVNLYAFVQKKGFMGAKEYIGDHNDREIKKAFKTSDIVLIAWGSNNSFEDRKKSILTILSSFPSKNILKTKSHPSRGTYKNFILPFTN